MFGIAQCSLDGANKGSQLADLPRGYVFAVPRSHDSRKYILGHPSGKSFRRSADFLPHLKWLMSGGSSETPCICCLCHPDRPLPSSNLKRPSPHSNASKGKRITGSLRKLKHVVIELPRRAEMAPVEPSELVPIPHTLITPAEPWC
ncbi:hypothetical protein BX666DRAFT_1975773 [Dichotomocladium elegans]|nr:hypothetical protein BX666DRAFT_1975773 [Dichotomocladium elegans]